MVYFVIGLMSGSSLDGLDIAFCKLDNSGKQWNYEILHTACEPFDDDWKTKLTQLTSMSAKDFVLTHTAFGHWIAKAVNKFVDTHALHHKVNFIASHGHTAFHFPEQGTSVQIGCGAAIAADTGIATITDLRAMDCAYGGQGAPIVPIAEQLLFPQYQLFLNIGGISNITFVKEGKRIAFDVVPANRVLNELAKELHLPYDANGGLAARGKVNQALLQRLNELDYYKQSYPKSLANEFGLEIIYPILQESGIILVDKFATMCEHIAIQIAAVIPEENEGAELLVTGGGAFNTFLINRIQHYLNPKNIKVVVPDKSTVENKEALAMALIGVLRWREEANVISSVTGASQDSIGGALWMVN